MIARSLSEQQHAAASHREGTTGQRQNMARAAGVRASAKSARVASGPQAHNTQPLVAQHLSEREEKRALGKRPDVQRWQHPSADARLHPHEPHSDAGAATWRRLGARLRTVVRVAGGLQAEGVQALVGHAQHGHVAPVPLQRLPCALARVRSQLVAAGERAHAHLPHGCTPLTCRVRV